MPSKTLGLFKQPGLVAGLLVLCAVCAYIPALRAGFVWDDERYVAPGHSAPAEEGLNRARFPARAGTRDYPAAAAFSALENRLWGSWPMGFHLASVLGHALAAMLFYVLLLRQNVRGAALAAFLFVLSPVCVESVAWVTETRNVLATVFSLGSALCFFGFSPLDSSPPAKNRALLYGLALAFFSLAVLSKPVGAVFPAAILTLIWWKKGRISKKNLAALVPFIVLAAGYGLASIFLERVHMGASGPDWDFSLADRVLIAGRALWFEAAKLAWPLNPAFIYPRWEVDARVWWQYLYPATAIAAFVALIRYRRTLGRGPAAAALFFGVCLSPFLGFFNIYPHRFSFVADRFAYLASLGFFALAGAGIARLAQGQERRSQAAALLAVLLLVFYGVKTFEQCGIYANDETLWSATATANPQAWIAHNNLGILADAKGDREKALAHYQAALRAKPDLPEAHYNMGVTLSAMGRTAEAVAHYRESVRLWPDYAWGHCNLGAALLALGKQAEAMAHFQRALDISPDFYFAHYNLGNAYLESGSFVEAIPQYEAAVLAAPKFIRARVNLGIALSQMGLWKEAITQFEQALSANPRLAEAHFNLARAYDLTGNWRKAVRHYHLALRFDRDLGQAHARLGDFYARAGKPDRAITHLEQALSRGTETAAIHYQLARLYDKEGKWQQAEAQYLKSLALDPKLTDAWNNLGLLYMTGRQDEMARMAFEKALSLDPESIPSCYNMACLHARRGAPDQAILWLKKAVGAGFRDQDRLLSDPDLASVRPGREFKEFFKDNFSR